ncbi:threonine-phosphate decarboxylase [Fervidicella metallireducens AeB]|uniref:Threonine-phosphate decarboxylase n=1 Tax=Fervidicella metallireducens AeB TaxID=1403537 RepID=A0A017RXA7_9CLOT|nr:histidinol-phosphate transaminase [Fervidicella metallireducens]EYE89221.1 threonine-phosphate decarboxylase [Fervidicella metallireducens AeB]
MKHGGDILTYRHLYDGRIRDFSSNINPIGMPFGLKEKILNGIKELTKYPDIQYRNLKSEIAKYLGCNAGNIIVGNGAVEIINNISFMFNRVVVVTPCFSEYIERPEIFGKEIVKLPLDEEFEINIKLIKETISEGDLLILGNPNNPTGKRMKENELIEIHETIKEKNAFLLLDEAFFEFCPEDYDSIKLFSDSEDICIIRAATKFFALPGVRLGYAFTSKTMVEKYNRIALPWSVNTFAEIAAEHIFNDQHYITSSRDYIAVQREYLLSELRGIENIKVYDTHCNFILIKLLDDNEDNIFEYLAKKGILVRKASSFEGLDNSYIRVAIKDFSDNKYLVNALREYQQWRKQRITQEA